MIFKENTLYTFQKDFYELVTLKCTCIQDGVVYFQTVPNYFNPIVVDYKLILKTNKLYKWNEKFMSWDTQENTICELGTGNVRVQGSLA